jgi:hypothetical protein
LRAEQFHYNTWISFRIGQLAYVTIYSRWKDDLLVVLSYAQVSNLLYPRPAFQC